LMAANRLGLKLTIVLLHNDGGGIFDFLPVSNTRPRDDFVQHVATPHGLDFAHAAALFGCGYEVATTVDDFRAALGRALAADRTSIVAVPTDRSVNVELHTAVWQEVAQSVRPAA
jgi:2-succinyl-5-enolpyruvyl-6-hydroxy-3-cyclohexene-1-carboxylate synthase